MKSLDFASRGRLPVVESDLNTRGRDRVKALGLVLVSMGVLALGVLRVHSRHKVVQVGYQLSEARGELQALEEEYNRLSLEASILTSPGRIERLAESLGMKRPTPEQVRIVPTKGSVASR